MTNLELLESIENIINKLPKEANYFGNVDGLKYEIKSLKRALILPVVVRQSEQLSGRPNTSSTLECFTKSEKLKKENG